MKSNHNHKTQMNYTPTMNVYINDHGVAMAMAAIPGGLPLHPS